MMSLVNFDFISGDESTSIEHIHHDTDNAFACELLAKQGANLSPLRTLRAAVRAQIV